MANETWIPLLGGSDVLVDGVALPRRGKINFLGGGASDNPALGATDIPAGGGAGGIALTSLSVTIAANGTIGSGGAFGTSAQANTASSIRIAQAASYIVRGIEWNVTPGVTHPSKTIFNDSAFDILLTHQDGAATAKNRFSLPGAATVIIAPGKSRLLEYDYAAQRVAVVPVDSSAPYTTYVLPGHGVVGDGTTDDGPALSALATIAAALGGSTFTFAGPRSYRIATSVSLPRSVTVEPENGAVLVVSAGITLTIAGAIEAPPLQRWLNTSAASSTVLIPGGTVYPEWWGAQADDGVTDNHDPIWAALNSLRGGKGGVLRFADTRGYYGTATTIVFATDAIFSGITIEGMGWNTEVRHTTVRAYSVATDDGIFTLSATNSVLTFKNLKISGFDTTDFVKMVRLGFCEKVVFDKVWANNGAREGLYAGDGANGCKEVSFLGCKATNVGVWSGQYVSAFNANANKTIIANCQADNCGYWVEHTGVGLAVTGCVFSRALSRGLTVMSTSWCNGEVVVACNVLTDATAGVYVADGTRSVGKVLITANVILRCAQGVVVGNRPSSAEPSMVTNNYFEHGSIGNEAVYVSGGGGIVQGNTFARVTGTSQGSIAGTVPSPTRTLTLTPTDQTGRNLPSIAAGTTLTIAGVPGTHTVASVDGLGGVTLSADVTVTVAAALVTFSSAQWGYLVRCDTDDYSVVKDNTIIGVPWTTWAFRVVSTKTGFSGNTFEPRGEALGAAAIYGCAPGQQLLSGTDINVTVPFTLGGSQQQTIYHSAVPTVGTWYVKDRIENSGSGANLAWACTVAGTAGTLNGGTTTGAITVSTLALTVNNTFGLHVGCYIAIAGVAGVKRVTAIVGSVITIDTVASATVGPTAAVSFSAPTFIPVGARQAASQTDSVAATVGALVTDFNALLAKFRAAGVMA